MKFFNINLYFILNIDKLRFFVLSKYSEKIKYHFELGAGKENFEWE